MHLLGKRCIRGHIHEEEYHRAEYRCNLPVEFTVVDFVGSIILCTIEYPIAPAVGWGLQPCPNLTQICLCWYILFSISPGIPQCEPQLPSK